jgi:acetylornithine deacetylase
MKGDFRKVISFLEALISTPSLSKDEAAAAQVVRRFLEQEGIAMETRGHNTWAFNKHHQPNLPTILLNSHIDTVRASDRWSKEPFRPTYEDGKLYGLGSNDAGGALAALWGCFLHYYPKQNLPYNLCWAATAEEEISGQNGIASIADITQQCTFAIIGEPTEMQMATAERGLMVLDAEVKGVAGHAARDTGINAIYLAMEDVLWFKNAIPEKVCPVLGPTKMTVTIIEAGKQHNVVPDSCKYVVDIRTTAAYEYEDLLNWITDHTHAEIKARSTRLKPSLLPQGHPLVKVAETLKIPTFGSATLSDQALLNIPSVKIGPGKSERSHTADEFIYVEELQKGLDLYIDIIQELICLSTEK